MKDKVLSREVRVCIFVVVFSLSLFSNDHDVLDLKFRSVSNLIIDKVLSKNEKLLQDLHFT